MSSRKLKLVNLGATEFKLTEKQGGGNGTVVTLGFNRILTQLEINGLGTVVRQAIG